MRRCVIVGGAKIGDYAAIRRELREDDFYIFCDGGLNHMPALGVPAHLIVGDFDSHPLPDLDIETVVLPREKDDTDTVYAAKEALKRGFEEFLLVGVTGGRIDHTLGNLSVLLMLDAQKKKAKIVDDYSEMEIVSETPAYVEDSFLFFSLLNISGEAAGIGIENAKYPLRDGVITCEYPYGISNEVLPGKKARISLNRGRLLLVKVRCE